MLKLRLQRIGRKNDPSYRVVVVDSRQGPKSGKFIDLVGTFNPKMSVLKLEAERIKEWLAKGVKASPTVHNMLVSEKIIDAKKINVLPRKTPIIKEEEAPAEAPAATEEVSEKTEEESPQEEKTEEVPAEEKEEKPQEATA